MNAEEAFLSALNVTIDTTAYPKCQPLLTQATALIGAGKIPVISHKGLSFSDRNKPEFKRYRTKIYQLYRNPAYAVGNCLHEAAHALLMEEDGIQNVAFSGPGVLRKADGSLFPYGARVDGDPQPEREVNAAFVFEKTTHMVVGDEAMRKYSGIKDASDRGDYDLFLQNCASTPEFFNKETPDQLWKRAIEYVEPWLQKTEIKLRTFARAAEYLVQLYP